MNITVGMDSFQAKPGALHVMAYPGALSIRRHHYLDVLIVFKGKLYKASASAACSPYLGDGKASLPAGNHLVPLVM